MMKVLRLALPLCLAISSASCSSCRGEPEVEGDTAGHNLPTVQIPNSPSALTRAFAERLDAGTRAVFVVRDFGELLAAYPALRPRIAPLVGDLGMIETDLRNTLGVDIARPETLEAVGIAARGGAAIAMVGRQPIVMVYLSNPSTFREHVTRVLAAQPFALSAPVEETTAGSAQVMTFRRAVDGPSKIMIAVDRGMAYFVPDVGEDRAAAVASLTGAAGPAGHLADDIAFGAAIDRFDGFHVFGWVSLTGIAEDEAARIASRTDWDEARRQRLGADARRMGRAGNLAFGFSLTGERIDYRQLLTPDEQMMTSVRAILATDGTNPSFARIVGSDAYMLARFSIDYAALLDQARTDLPAGLTDDLVESLQLLDQAVGLSSESELLPALGNNVLVLATRARLLTLRRVLADLRNARPAELATGLGLVVALEVDDRAVVERALRGLVVSLGTRAIIEDLGGNLVVRFTDAEADVGNLVLTNDLLIVVPERNRDDLMNQLQQGINAEALADESARRIVNDTAANGVYVNFAQMIEGPIGQAASGLVPELAMNALRNLGVAHARFEVADGSLLTEASLVFAPLPPATPPSTP